jgi:hypothetical protein
MDCENYEAVVVDLLYGELSPERRAEAQAHAGSCAECGKLSKELEDARNVAATLPARIAPPRELDERILLAARAAADVRKHPFRGSGLHVAVAAVIGMILVGVSFAVGMKVGHPTSQPDPEDNPIVDRPDPHGHLIRNGTPSHNTRNTDIAKWRDYMEAMLKLANDDLAKGEVKRALMEFGGVYASGGKTPMALEAGLGMAKCYEALGQLEDARVSASDARTKNDEWGLHLDPVEDGATQLIKKINDELKNQRPR